MDWALGNGKTLNSFYFSNNAFFGMVADALKRSMDFGRDDSVYIFPDFSRITEYYPSLLDSGMRFFSVDGFVIGYYGGLEGADRVGGLALNEEWGMGVKPDVSVVIVNYNTKDLTISCMESIFRYTQGVDYEVIVVDNASSDGSVEAIRAFGRGHQEVVLCENAENVGFGRANNIGVAEAEGKYIFLLNSDTVLQNDAVSLFYEKAESGYQDYILGSYLLDREGCRANSYSDIEDIFHILLRDLYLCIPFLYKVRKALLPLKFEAEALEEKDVGFIIGADMFLRRDVFERIGGFDEHIFMYGEDEDFALRALKIGIKSRIILEPQIIHLEGGSMGESWKKKRIRIKAYHYFLRKHLLK